MTTAILGMASIGTASLLGRGLHVRGRTALQLDDIDVGNRRLVIAGRIRPLDDLTRQILLSWLDHRAERWPNTANPHLFINQQTAMETGAVSTFWAKKALRGQTATLERLRVDRQLEEALTHGPDPLHLASVFGLDQNGRPPSVTRPPPASSSRLRPSSTARQPPTVPPNPRANLGPNADGPLGSG